MENPFHNALAIALNIEGEELTNLVKEGDSYKSDAQSLLLGKIQAHIDGLKSDLKGQYEKSRDNLVNKAIKETSERFEKPLIEKFGLQVGEGDDIVEALLNKSQEWRNSDVDLEKVKSHPDFIKLVADTQELKQQLETVSPYKEKFEGLQQQIEKNKLNAVIGGLVDEYWNKQEHVDYASPEMRSNWHKEFKARVLNAANYKVLDDGRAIPVNEAGENLVDNLHHPITIERIIEQSFTGYVPTKQSSKRDSSGGGGGGGSETSYTGPMPKNSAELTKILNTPGLSTKAKSEIIEYCEKNNIL